MMNHDFVNYAVDAPSLAAVAREYDEIHAQLDKDSTADWVAAVQRWDALRRSLSEWKSLTDIRFHQDTRNADYKLARQHCDKITPELIDLEVKLKRRLVESRYREMVSENWGAHAINLWECDIASFNPSIQSDLVRQSELEADYTELIASARFDFEGQQHTLSELRRFAERPEREIRHQTARLRSEWFEQNRESLDRLYDDLVHLRHGMAQKIGYNDFVDLGYQLMQRTDYDQHDVEEFRAQVRDEVVPICVELKSRQARALHVDPMMAWDEALYDVHGNPAPRGDHDWMIRQARCMFEAIGGEISEFFAEMCQRHMLDLKSREGKAAGGFCAGLPEFGMPFIFANFNGTKGDVEVFTHEMGHAFQNHCSRRQPLSDFLWPTSEACEIHSMGLEFLCWPQMELFFGDAADRFRTIHLASSIAFLPYGVAVDHFQHLVYQQPDASPDQRCAMWREMEQTYLPWRQWGDLANEASGRLWQAQLHIYVSPFYYIDYTLALTCALQLWVLSRSDPRQAAETYVALCRRGGEAPFKQLVDSAGLRSPFVKGSLTDVVRHAESALESF